MHLDLQNASFQRKIHVSLGNNKLRQRKHLQHNFNRFLCSTNDLPQHFLVSLPALSPTMEMGTIVSWEKKEGDKLNDGDLLAEIETDKATMGFETPEEGYLAKILIPAGTKDIPIGKLLCIIVPDENDIKAFANYTPKQSTTVESAAKSSPEKFKAESSRTSSQQPETTQHSILPTQPAPVSSQIKSSSNARILASPLARSLAKEKGIDLSLLSGTGPGGRIRANDVLNASPQKSLDQPTLRSVDMIDISLTNIRQTIAKRLTMSKQTIPHYYLTAEIEINELIRAREQLNEMLKSENIKLSINDFIIKASALACLKVPQVNSSWQETFIRQFNTVDISIAVSTDSGLITPIVFNAESKGLSEISNTVKTLAKKARDGKLQPQEFQGGTFTISNLGMFGVTNFSAVINPPQSCILAVGNTENRLVPDTEGKPKASKILTVTLSCDHRVVDGAVGATWLKQFRQFISKPFSMML
ncbi:dihydrolipoyllysine-residue acetyltransferase, mitochondrial-like protein [Sarcoptes scabiei]|uniref:Acetyltransferase component of pyruvate dehydrogenase complex n=1 Tax=Sarcoptes scabiei TaxID=52283 RepID=A0A132AJE5_SARSC|nr:dihydrolipoyllysine-residue acetyltransferase, mitochondrial-like protein [Sarcoptes scabiei]